MVKRTGISMVFMNHISNQLRKPPFIGALANSRLHPLLRFRNSSCLALAGALSLGSLRLCYSAMLLMIFKKSSYSQASPTRILLPSHLSSDLLVTRLFEFIASPPLHPLYQGGLSWQFQTEAPALSALLIPPIT